jgi:aquaporin Z
MLPYLAEFIGTFVFVAVILILKNPYLIVLTLLIVILLTSSISGGNINPAVSTAMYFNGTLNVVEYLGYVVSQLLGAIAAYYLSKQKSLMKLI